MGSSEDISLTGGGDCFSHWHSADRVPTADFLHGLQSVAARVDITGDYQILLNDDYLVVDTTTGNVTLTLPIARNGNEVEILKKVGANMLTVLPTGTDTILQNTGVTIYSANAALHFKAFGTDWRLI